MPAANAATAADAPAWEYSSFCYFNLDVNAGSCDEDVAHVYDCTGEPFHPCVTSALTELGAQGWMIQAEGGGWPDVTDSHLLYRVAR